MFGITNVCLGVWKKNIKIRHLRHLILIGDIHEKYQKREKNGVKQEQ